ncbi:LOG family protein [Rhodocaloribacter sp.]
MIRHVGVYCASSNHIDEKYFAVASETGRLLAERGHTLVYGGGNVGLMGTVARAVHEHGGEVFGVIPDALRQIEGVAYEVADELIITETMQERKRLMFTRAEAFLVLPGGFGTLEEFMEVLTLRQLGYHHKPIALVNTDGFYAPLLDLFEHYYRTGFARARYRALYHVAPTPADALDHIAEEG